MPKHAHEPLNGRKDFGPERALRARPLLVAPSAGRHMDFNHGVKGAAQSRRREIEKDPEWVVEHLLGEGMKPQDVLIELGVAQHFAPEKD